MPKSCLNIGVSVLFMFFFFFFRYSSLSSLTLSGNEKVLLLWGAHNEPESVKDSVNVLKQKIGDGGHVQVENMDRLVMCKFPKLRVIQGAKLLGSGIPGEPKIDGGNPNFGQGFLTENLEIVSVIKSILILN